MIMWNYSSSTLNSLVDSCTSDLGVYGNMGAHDFIIVRPASVAADMKDTPWQGGVVCPETYHGTKMNKRALDFHTQLHDWSESQNLSTVVKRHPRLLSAKGSTEVFLPIKRLAHIESWTRDVNKYYHPERGPRGRSGSFMVIDVSKFHMKVDKKENSNRVKSAIYPSLAKGRVVSAVSNSSTGVRRRFFGNDVHTVTNKLADTQLHYSAQRRELYSASTRKSQPANKDEDGTVDIQESESDELSTLNTSTKPSEPSEEVANPIEKDILQPKITARSWSNRMLNVISIDDCKLTCRYRPQTIKETHEPPADKTVKDKKDNKKLVKKGNKSATVDKDEDKNGRGEEADDEADNSEDITHTSGKLNGHTTNGIDTNNNQHLQSAENETNNNSSNGNNESSNRNEKTQNSDDKDSLDGVKTDKTVSSESNKCQNTTVRMDRESVMTPSDKTSYGRITNLYSSSQVTDNSKEQKKKKQTRVYKINHAINDVVQDRKVMNSMDRDFDTRTSVFGRTVVDKSEGSDMFRKLHSNLRRKIDNYLDTHSAIKAQQFYEMRRKNSASTTPTPTRESGRSSVNNK